MRNPFPPDDSADISTLPVAHVPSVPDADDLSLLLSSPHFCFLPFACVHERQPPSSQSGSTHRWKVWRPSPFRPCWQSFLASHRTAFLPWLWGSASLNSCGTFSFVDTDSIDSESAKTLIPVRFCPICPLNGLRKLFVFHKSCRLK